MTNLSFTMALPWNKKFVISTGAKRSGEICGFTRFFRLPKAAAWGPTRDVADDTSIPKPRLSLGSTFALEQLRRCLTALPGPLTKIRCQLIKRWVHLNTQRL